MCERVTLRCRGISFDGFSDENGLWVSLESLCERLEVSYSALRAEITGREDIEVKSFDTDFGPVLTIHSNEATAFISAAIEKRDRDMEIDRYLEGIGAWRVR